MHLMQGAAIARFAPFVLASALCVSCGSTAPPTESICGSERPCLPEGIWTVSYEMPASGQGFGSDTIHIRADGVEVLGESVSDDTCSLGPPIPGDLITSAELSNDGCTLTAEISKSWCNSGEGQCESRKITLDFCSNGSTSVAAGSLEACRCWFDGSSPFCGADESDRSLVARATRTES